MFRLDDSDSLRQLDERPYASKGVRAVGITMFLECSRKGVVPVVMAEEGGLPF